MVENGLHPFSSDVGKDPPLSTAAPALKDLYGERAAQKFCPVQLSAGGLRDFRRLVRLAIPTPSNRAVCNPPGAATAVCALTDPPGATGAAPRAWLLCCRLVPALLVVLLVLGAPAPRPLPLWMFSKHPVPVEHLVPTAPVLITSAKSRMFRTRLREAASRPPDFAGHYIVATWGCGSSCVSAAFIDARTGVVTHLPFIVAYEALFGEEPLHYRLNSNVLIVNGSRNEKGHGVYVYQLLDGRLRLLRQTETPLPQPSEE